MLPKELDAQITALKSIHINGVDCFTIFETVVTELNNIDDYAARLEKYGEEDKAEGLFEASARIRNTMQKVLDCPPEKVGD